MADNRSDTIAKSYLDGANAGYIEQLHAKFLVDPNSIDSEWRAYFTALKEDESAITETAAGPSWARADWPPQANGELVSALDGQWPVEEAKKLVDAVEKKSAEADVTPDEGAIQAAARDSMAAMKLIRSYRIRGHRKASLDPLNLAPPNDHPELHHEFYGFF